MSIGTLITSRRNFLIRASAFTAASATPAVALAASPDTDPAIAAIKAYHRARVFDNECLAKADVIEKRIHDRSVEIADKADPKGARLCKSMHAARKKYYPAYNHPELTKAQDRYYASAHQKHRLVALDSLKETHAVDYIEMERLRSEGSDALTAAMWVVVDTAPTTLVGAIAMIDWYVGEGDRGNSLDIFTREVGGADQDLATALLLTISEFMVKAQRAS